MNTRIIFIALLCGVIFTLQSRAQTKESVWEPPYVGSDPTVLYLPDAKAVYWRYGWERKPGDTGGVVISGTFPDARYFSYNVYDDTTKSSLGSFADQELTPADGGSNPFKGGENTQSNYTIHVVPEGTKVDAENVLYFPDSLTKVSVFLRHYVPNGDIYGGVPMPEIANFDASTGEQSAAATSTAIPKLSRAEVKRYLIPMMKNLVNKFEDNPREVLSQIHHRDKNETLKINELVARQVCSKAFDRFHEGELIQSFRLATAGTYPNKDNLYLVLPVVRETDEVLLVSFKAPSYPKSPAEYPDAPLRYFSLSQGDDISYGFGTVIDKDMTVHEDGNIYFLIGDEEAALKEKAQQLGANFMPWKAKEKMLLIYRHMLPKDDYEHGINQVAIFSHEKPEQGQEGSAFIGDYSPIGKLISKQDALSLKELPELK